jgi:hypothetical protein
MPEPESKKQKKVVMDLPDPDRAGKTVYLVKTEDHVAPIEITVQLQPEPVDAWRHTAAKGLLTIIVSGLATKGVEWAYDAAIRGIRNRRASDS